MGRHQFRGVNLGGWFVVEPWMTPALFAGTNGVALVIQAAAVAFSNYVLELESLTADNVAKVVAILLGTLFRFWAYRRFVFAGEPI